MTEERPSDDKIARRIHIKGKVQAVWYRGWTVEQARELGVDGWVRNRIDGSVEAVAVGPAAQVEELIRRCHQGPPAARVDAVNVEETAGIVGAGFVQKPTV